MKAIMIIHNQGLRPEIFQLLDKLEINGFTRWENVHGRGSTEGEPRMGTHTWPSLNNAILTFVEESKKAPLLEGLKLINEEFPQQGLRAFVWEAEDGV